MTWSDPKVLPCAPRPVVAGRLGSTFSIDTALVPQLGGANVWTGSNDFSSATSFRLPPKPFFVNYKAANCLSGTVTSTFSAVSGAAPTAACALGHANTVLGVLQFGDSATNAVQDHFPLPPDWTGAFEIEVVWRAAQTTGNVVWSAQLACAGASQSADPTFGDAVTTTAATDGTANAMTMTTITSIPATGCTADKEVFFRFYRDGASASDTMTGDAELLSLRVGYYRAL